MTASSASADVLTASRYSRCYGIERGVEQQLRHADDAVHRRPNLMAHIGQKLALGLAGGFGLILSLKQLGGMLCHQLLHAGAMPLDLRQHFVEGVGKLAQVVVIPLHGANRIILIQGNDFGRGRDVRDRLHTMR